jgi:hypothetical protein
MKTWTENHDSLIPPDASAIHTATLRVIKLAVEEIQSKGEDNIGLVVDASGRARRSRKYTIRRAN